MRFVKAAVLAFIGLTVATPVPLEDDLVERTPTDIESSLEKRASNSYVSGLKFNIDGTTQYFAGTNSYWIGFLTNNADVDLVMSHIKASGLKVLRIWGKHSKHNLLAQVLTLQDLTISHQAPVAYGFNPSSPANNPSSILARMGSNVSTTSYPVPQPTASSSLSISLTTGATTVACQPITPITALPKPRGTQIPESKLNIGSTSRPS